MNDYLGNGPGHLYYDVIATVRDYLPTNGAADSVDYLRTATTGDFVWNFVLVTLALLAVTGLAYFVLRMLGRARGPRSNRNIKILEGLAVAQHATVQLIKAGDKCFLIGVSRNGITLLGEVSGDKIDFDAKIMPEMPFKEYLQRFMKGKGKGKEETNEEN